MPINSNRRPIMEYRKLGNTDLKLSVIGFGCWAMGGGWGQTDDRESIAAVRRALDLGINFFDTADIYGFGHSEEMLAEALGSRRKDVILATKVGLAWDEHGCLFRSSSRHHIMNAVEASLRRLRTDYIDLYQIHWPDSYTSFEITMKTMDDLVKSGKVRYVGVSNFTVRHIKECMNIGPIHSLQPPYNMFMRDAERGLLTFCKKNGIGVVAYGPLAYGLLTGKFTKETEFPKTDWRSGELFPDPGDWQKHIDLFHGKQFRRNLHIVERVKKIADKHGKTVGQLAIAWVLSNPSITSAIVGAKRPSQIEENVGGAGWWISKEELLRIDEILDKTP
jgi:aryl-alcohol dehydrogenase-like predicted oxidoreductase